MGRFRFLLILVLMFMTASVGATVINVPDDYPTIQQGIDASSDGDTVLVQPGTYEENINFNGHNIALGSLFLTTGDTTFIAETVIRRYEARCVVTFENGESRKTIITGFTISNALGRDFGGGIHCNNSSSPIISHNVITDNSALVAGGGICCEDNSNPIIIGNMIMGNSSRLGNAICCIYSDPIILYNYIFNNVMFTTICADGGGISCYASNAIIYGNYIKYNMAFSMSCGRGGGILCEGYAPVIVNNVIYDNAADYGGGIYCTSASSPTIINNAIVENWAGDGGGLYIEDTSVQLTNIIARNNAGPDSSDQIYGFAIVRYSNIQGGWEGEGNIDADPLFRDPENGDFHLMSTACGDPYDSPCIDAGDPNIIDSLLDCSRGLGFLRSDMGAYGGGDSATVGIDDYLVELPQALALVQNYPNPFNSSTSINYSLPEQTYVRIQIYNVLGQKMTTLFDGSQQAGYHLLVWKANDYPSGIYFYSIETGSFNQTKRCVLLK